MPVRAGRRRELIRCEFQPESRRASRFGCQAKAAKGWVEAVPETSICASAMQSTPIGEHAALIWWAIWS